MSNNEDSQLEKLGQYIKLESEDPRAPKFIASTKRENNKFNLLVLNPNITKVSSNPQYKSTYVEVDLT
jgi:hypothetical protein